MRLEVVCVHARLCANAADATSELLLLVSLVHVDALDLPLGGLVQHGSGLVAVDVRVAGSDRVVVDVVLLEEVGAVVGEPVSAHRPADRQVDDEVVVLEVVPGASRSRTDREEGVGLRPLRRIGADALVECLSQVVGESVRPRKDPRPDESRCRIPLHGVNSAAPLVHGFPESPVLGVDGGAALVEPLVGRPDEAVVRLELRVVVGDSRRELRHARGHVPVARPLPTRHVSVHVALFRGVQDRLGDRLGVDGLDDVDLSVVGPNLPVRRPKGGPEPAAGGHLHHVQDEQPVVEPEVSLQPNRVPWAVSQVVVGFPGLRRELDVLGPVIGRDDLGDAEGLGFLADHVRVVSRRSQGIPSVEEGVIVEEGLSRVGLDQGVVPRAVELGGNGIRPFGYIFRHRVDRRAELRSQHRIAVEGEMPPDGEQANQPRRHQREVAEAGLRHGRLATVIADA
mmetsp:Transcript_25772/g.60422  ORF Transcript_25772/g.60422 Transcript_25772/m.60422 type:complete len:453 (+) Transcript_25772:89-1447(+)